MVNSKPLRIWIDGASGVGKTTLAKALAKEYELKFISNSASVHWPKFGVKNHTEIYKLPFEAKLQYQKDILAQLIDTSQEEGLQGRFVTDRSPLGSIVHSILQLGHEAESSDLNEIIFGATNLIGSRDLVIYLPFTDEVQLENNSMRVYNHWYQRVVCSVYQRVIIDPTITCGMLPNVLTLDMWNLDNRLSKVDKAIRKIQRRWK